MTTRHGTVTLNRTLNAAPSRVWAAFAEAEARAIWSSPDPDLDMTFTETDFRNGGRDLCVFGPGPAEGVTVETLYHAIEPQTRIVYTEVIGLPDAPDGISLVTVTLAGEGDNTALSVTLQVTSLGPEDAQAEIEAGWHAALDAMAAYLAR